MHCKQSCVVGNNRIGLDYISTGELELRDVGGLTTRRDSEIGGKQSVVV